LPLFVSIPSLPAAGELWRGSDAGQPLDRLLHNHISHALSLAGYVQSILFLTYRRTIVNEAAAASPKQPIVNMGQGFFGYNPPDFILKAAKSALDRVDCNQYSPTRGRPRLRKALADAYSPLWGRKLNPDTEVTITTGANEGRCLLCSREM
jgi:DNA-binding transcriptional MocR family regulator